jgi:pimeloyl-ACP methyl ester carboxylesterase
MTNSRPTRRSLWSRIRYVWIRLGLLSLVAMPAAMFLTFRAQGLPEGTLVDDEAVEVSERQGDLQFMAREATSRERVLLLPGCPVEPAAYAPLARALAAGGLTTSIMKIPFRCAPLAQHVPALQARVVEVQQRCPECRWTLAGHSRGATHALDLVAAMPQRFARLVIMGSTHPRERDFSHLTLPVMKIVATDDGVAPRADSEGNRRLLPASTRWEVIQGGNHAQFGYYGIQLFDGWATISREEQHARIVGLLRSFVTDQPVR